MARTQTSTRLTNLVTVRRVDGALAAEDEEPVAVDIGPEVAARRGRAAQRVQPGPPQRGLQRTLAIS